MPDLPNIPRTPMTPQTAAMAFLACAAYVSTVPRDPSVRAGGGMTGLEEPVQQPATPTVRLKPGGGWAACAHG
jgi:hypothetical protein